MVKAIRWPFAVVLSALLLTACAGAEPTRTPTTTQIEVTQTTPDTEATVAAAVEATIAARLKINFTPEPGGFWDANLDPPPGPDGKYPAGAEAKIRALLHLAHSSFVRWEGDASGTFPETSVIVDRDLQIHAVFLHVGTATPAPPTHPPTRQSIITQVPSVSCTPPPCRLGAGEVYYCAGVCPGGCGTTCATITPMPTPAPQPAVELGLFSEGVRILALGDSYTIGHNVGALERWPVQLAQRLREEGFQIDEPEIVARTGWTTQELTVAIEDAILEGPYQLVTLLIGVNNQYRGQDIERYRPEFVALLRRAVEYAGGEPSRVIVLSIPDWSVTPFAEGADRAKISAEIAAFNVINREEATLIGARYVDITPISREAENDPELLASDGLHPSAKMYEAWTALVLPEARAVLNER